MNDVTNQQNKAQTKSKSVELVTELGNVPGDLRDTATHIETTSIGLATELKNISGMHFCYNSKIEAILMVHFNSHKTFVNLHR